MARNAVGSVTSRDTEAMKTGVASQDDAAGQHRLCRRRTDLGVLVLRDLVPRFRVGLFAEDHVGRVAQVVASKRERANDATTDGDAVREGPVSALLQYCQRSEEGRDNGDCGVGVERIAGKGNDKLETHKSGVSAGSRRIMRATADISFLFKVYGYAYRKGVLEGRARARERRRGVETSRSFPSFGPTSPRLSCASYTKVHTGNLRAPTDSKLLRSGLCSADLARGPDVKEQESGLRKKTPRSHNLSHCQTVGT